ncbi:glycoside hydrolase family 32 protein [Flexithrix dorotheae]|uniref:glycoside hydrolase family 32 protein n=1 Tax=Flexithrix dorotheae TaxID=70993 RepID=UPI0003671F1A|nr:glycoside hydrolase family 32 protein [Flexithrix dorotheae]
MKKKISTCNVTQEIKYKISGKSLIINNRLLEITFLSFFLMLIFNSNSNSQSKEAHRPEFHFSPQKMWMNDPNGMVFYQGEYHLFYQHYPDNTVWGPMHWGHAVSKDLIHWEHLPIALFPDEHGYIFSGSAVVDHENTSGFGTKDNPPMVAIFTYHDAEKAKKGSIDFQTQGIAYSLDKGRSWTKYENNPVLNNPGIKDFRDPKVFWHGPSQKWIMILAVQNHVQLFNSSNLKDWSFLSKFGENSGSHGGVWECPDLFELSVDGKKNEKHWVMLVSINPGGPNGGSATQYFIGDFDGEKFTNSNSSETSLWVDYGKDNYAGVTWSDIPKKDGRRIFIGWMSNWQYANQVPTEKWRNAMTIPRKLGLTETNDGVRLQNFPVQELKKLRTDKLNLKDLEVEGKYSISEEKNWTSNTFELDLKIALEKSTGENFGIELSNSMGEKILIGFDQNQRQCYIDRRFAGKSDFSEKFKGKSTAPRIKSSNELKIRIIVDVASVEVFFDDGTIAMTEIFFPNEDFSTISFFSEEKKMHIDSAVLYKY